MKYRVSLMFVLLLTGCATAVTDRYVGKQQAWPVSTGAVVLTKYQMPIYLTLPPKPYEVIGVMRIESGWVRQAEVDHVPKLVASARNLGADALLFVNGKKFFGTDYGPPTGEAIVESSPKVNIAQSFNAEAFRPETTIVAIRWTRGAP